MLSRIRLPIVRALSSFRSEALVLSFFLVLLLAGSPSARAQSAAWNALTSLRDVTSIAVGSEALWVGTTGGLYSYAPGAGELRRFTVTDVEGLHGIQVRALAYDHNCRADRPCIWIGYQDGAVDRLDPSTREVRTFRDIERSDRFARKEINRMLVRGDSVLLATGFGVVVLDAVRDEVRDSYTQLGTLLPATPVFDMMIAPGDDGIARLWLATDAGVAHAPLHAPNLKDPASWRVDRAGLPSIETRSIAQFDGRIYVGTQAGLAVRRSDGTFENTGIGSLPILDLHPTDERLLGVDQFALIAVEPSGQSRRIPSPEFQRPVRVTVGPTGQLWLGDQFEGLVSLGSVEAATTTPDVLATLIPTGPYHNSFSALTVDKDGNLWAAGAEAVGHGFYRMAHDGSWTDFLNRTVPVLQDRHSFTQLHADRSGAVWFGSQGRGLAMVGPDDAVEIFDQTNSSLRNPSTSTNQAFILLGGVGSDPQGRIWATARAASRPLNVRDLDGTWTNLPLLECGGLTASRGTYDELFVDSYGQLWIDVKSQGNLRQGIGLVVLNPMNTPADPSDDVCRFFGSTGAAGSGMPGLHVNAVAEDKGGLTWVATDRGLAYFINNGLTARDATATPIWPQYEDRSQGVFLFQGLTINDIAPDPANQLWVATDAGAYLIRQVGSGFEEVAHHTQANSLLLSDVVVAVAVDDRTGRVFFATDRGLVSYAGDAIAASSESRVLFVYPNPVRVGPDESPAIFIEGLVEETEVMVVAPQGQVVTRFQARGGRARWDARDQSGRPVPSGMYLVVAIGQNGERTAFGKVGIIR